MHINKCPHCGKDGGLTFVDNKNPFLTEGKECVICCYCKTRTKYYRTEREAIEAWNEMAKVDYDS